MRSVLLLLLVAIACGESKDAAQPSHAVVDLVAVAKATGRDTVIQQQIEVATRGLNEQLVEAAKKMQEQLDAEKAKHGEKPTEEQTKSLAALTAAAHEKLQNNKMLAKLRQDEVRAQMIIAFRDEVRPIAAKIAMERGASIVITTSGQVVWFDVSIDITDELIAALRARDSEPKAAPAKTEE